MSEDKSNEMTEEFKYIHRIEDESEAIYDVLVEDRHIFEPDDADVSADKLDYQIAAFSGILTAAFDIFWVGDFSLSDAQSWGRKEVSEFVLKVSQSKGYKGTELDDAIKYLEKAYKIPSDRLTPEFGGGLYHHLRDFVHHPTIVALIMSILSQFTGKGYGTDTDGNFIMEDFPNDELIGSTFNEKIFNGTVIWAFHLVSDMAGSSHSAGKGTGIPGPILSFFKEISVLPVVRDITVKYQDDDIAFSVLITKIFNSTYFKGVRVDLRTELGITHELSRQTLPVLLNDCIVKGFYFVRRLCIEAQEKEVHSLADLKKLNASNFIPANSRDLTRMVMISSITFNVVEKSAAFTKAAVKNKGIKNNFVQDFLLNINFIGIAHFAVAFKSDVKYIYDDIKGCLQIKYDKVIGGQEIIATTSSVEIKTVLDFNNLYNARFELLFRQVESIRDSVYKNFSGAGFKDRLLFDLGDKDFSLYNKIVSESERRSYDAVEKLVTEVFKRADIIQSKERHGNINFILNENGKKFGVIFTRNTPPRREFQAKGEELRKYSNVVDGIKYVILAYPEGIAETEVNYYNNFEEQQDAGFVEFDTIKNMFDTYFGPDEFSLFSGYLRKFNERAGAAIGYGTVVIPSDDSIIRFREDIANFLRDYKYEDLLPDSIFKNQADILHKNYKERGLYNAMVGDSNFADSFISSEWYFRNYKITDYLDQTGVVTGYLKSVEQLLYAIARLSIDQGKTIKMKGYEGSGEYSSDNEDRIDSTLSSLIGFLEHNRDIHDVNSFVKRYIAGTIHDWRHKQRNGYFHKDNLHDGDKIAMIRQQAIYLYYLILGGCKVNDEDFDQLGINSAVERKAQNREKGIISYERFENWLQPLWGYGVPSNTVAFRFTLSRMNCYEENVPWSLSLTPTMRFDKDDYMWPLDSVSHNGFSPFPPFYWKDECTWEEALEMVRGIIKRYLQENEHADELKKYAAVGLSYVGRPVELLYKR